MLSVNDSLFQLKLSSDRKGSLDNAKSERQKADRVLRLKVYKQFELFEDGNCADLSDC